MASGRILLIEDDEATRFGLRSYLASRSYEVVEAATDREAREKLIESRPDIAILDHNLPDGNGLDLLRWIKATEPAISVVILTAEARLDLAVQSIREGAENFLAKPVELQALAVIIERILDSQRSRKKELAGHARERRGDVDPFLGESKQIRELENQARLVLGSESPILIRGATGTGKSLLAGWIHRNGSRANEAFVDANCAGFSRELLDSELFGHERGAFTGATSSKQGLLEFAHKGTVFLDEIGDMELGVQAKLLKVLEEKRFRRVGEVRDRRVDIRLVAATHQDLEELGQTGKFRRDLFFRISTLPLEVPSLRERPEDIPVLAREILRRLKIEIDRHDPELTSDGLEALQAHSWPGNIRELKNVLERALLQLPPGQNHLGPRYFRFSKPIQTGTEWSSDLTLQELEQLHIERVLEEEKGSIEKAARRLGISRTTLYEKSRKYQSRR